MWVKDKSAYGGYMYAIKLMKLIFWTADIKENIIICNKIIEDMFCNETAKCPSNYITFDKSW